MKRKKTKKQSKKQEEPKYFVEFMSVLNFHFPHDIAWFQVTNDEFEKVIMFMIDQHIDHNCGHMVGYPLIFEARLGKFAIVNLHNMLIAFGTFDYEVALRAGDIDRKKSTQSNLTSA